MEVDNGECSSSDEEMTSNVKEVLKPHTAEVRIDLGSVKSAEIVARSLSVDKEPSRSNAERTISVEESFLVIRVASADRRSLQKSLANLFDMCDLAKSTIELAEKKSWIDNKPVAKKPKLDV